MRKYLMRGLYTLAFLVISAGAGMVGQAADDHVPSIFAHVTNWIVAAAADDNVPSAFVHLTNLAAPGAPGAVTQVIGQSGVQSQINNPGDTNEHTLQTITIPANTLGANGCVSIDSLWSATNSGNAKTMRIRFSGASGTDYFTAAPTAITSIRNIAMICNRGATNSQVGGSLRITSASGATQSAIITSAVDTTASTTVLLTCQLATATEQCGVEEFSATVH